MEQEQAISEVEERLSVISTAEGQIDADLKRANRLRQSILKRAFEGKLVHQDPKDEPANALLERIKATRCSTSLERNGERGDNTRGEGATVQAHRSRRKNRAARGR